MNLFDKNIGQRLHEVRKNLELSQQEFAEKLGIDRRTVHLYEKNNSQTVKLELLFKIAEIWNIDLYYLVTGNSPAKVKEESVIYSAIDPAEFSDLKQKYNSVKIKCFDYIQEIDKLNKEVEKLKKELNIIKQSHNETLK